MACSGVSGRFLSFVGALDEREPATTHKGPSNARTRFSAPSSCGEHTIPSITAKMALCAKLHTFFGISISPKINSDSLGFKEERTVTASDIAVPLFKTK